MNQSKIIGQFCQFGKFTVIQSISRPLTSKTASESQIGTGSSKSIADEDGVSDGAHKLTWELAMERRKRREVLGEILRVDHAGEIGANYIYKGQLSALGQNSPASHVIEEMWSHEKEHLRILEKMLPQERVRPSLLRPLWESSGYMLGFVTGLMGEKAAMACTDAVEESIVNHYNNQIRTLLEKKAENGENYEDIVKILSQMRDEEQHHQDLSKDHDSESAPFYTLMKNVIKAGCNAAIFTAEKI